MAIYIIVNSYSKSYSKITMGKPHKVARLSHTTLSRRESKGLPAWVVKLKRLFVKGIFKSRGSLPTHLKWCVTTNC